MRATLDIPDELHRRAKARAQILGMPLRQFVTEAIEELLVYEKQLSREYAESNPPNTDKKLSDS